MTQWEMIDVINSVSNLNIERMDMADKIKYLSVINRAANTIEALSTKLAAADEQLKRLCKYKERLETKITDMNQSAEDCGDGWIYCGGGKNLPEEHGSMFAKFKGTDKWDSAMFEKTSDDVNVTVEFEDGKRKVKTLHTVDGKWNGGNRGVKFRVIAWRPLPLEYKGRSEERGDSK